MKGLLRTLFGKPKPPEPPKPEPVDPEGNCRWCRRPFKRGERSVERRTLWLVSGDHLYCPWCRDKALLDRHAPDCPPIPKLVRDKVPDIIGPSAETHIADEAEYKKLLREKLVEEAFEFVGSGDPEELADVLEVVRALCVAHGWSNEEMRVMRLAKAEARGGFEKRIVLENPGAPKPV